MVGEYGTSRTLPTLPDIRNFHTAENLNLCGGEDTSESCLQWTPDTGTWEELLTLDVGRDEHVSWSPENGIGTYLMGGCCGSTKSTTLIKPDGTQEPGFPLKYDT